MPMPIYSSGAWQRLRDAFDLKGKHSLLLDEVVVPVAVVAELSGVEGSQTASATAFIGAPAAGALIKSACLLSNLFDGTSRLIVEAITAIPSLTTSYTIGLTTIAPILPIAASTIVKQWDDQSRPGVPPGSAFANEGIFSGSGQMFEGVLASNQFKRIPVNIVLNFGDEIYFQCGNNNTATACTYQYRVESV